MTKDTEKPSTNNPCSLHLEKNQKRNISALWARGNSDELSIRQPATKICQVAVAENDRANMVPGESRIRKVVSFFSVQRRCLPAVRYGCIKNLTIQIYFSLPNFVRCDTTC